MKSIINSAAIFLLILFTWSCEEQEGPDPQAGSNPSAEVYEDPGESNYNFGIDLFRQLNKDQPDNENILISPVSIQTALYMLANGAEGNTRSEILQNTFTGVKDIDELNQEQQSWRNMLIQQSGHPTLIDANAYFKDPQRIRSNADFEERLSTYFGAEKQSKDFGNPGTVEEINKWVEDNTEGKIDEILDEIGPDDVAFLINALYFQADWLNPFPEESTRDMTFNLLQGGEMKIPFMNADASHNFIKNEEYIALDKPFKDSTFSLTVIKPELQNVQSFINEIDAGFIEEMYGGLRTGRAIVNLPLMEIEFNEEIGNSLANIGIRDAFDQHDADLSNMGSPLIGPNLFVSRVDHGTFLKVDEKGAEGAAVTSISISATSAPPVLTFNEPFVLILRHIESNSLVFIGRILEPV